MAVASVVAGDQHSLQHRGKNSEHEEAVYATTIFARGATVPWIN